MRFRLLIFVGFIYSGLAHGQTTLFDQTPIEIGNPDTQLVSFASTTMENVEDEIPNRTYDNFSLESDSTITGLGWRGTYNGPFNPNPDLRSNVDFEIEIFGNLSNRSPDLSQSFMHYPTLDAGTAANDDGMIVSKSLVPNQLTRNLGVVVDYLADLSPFQLEAGDYWLSVRAKMDFPSADQFNDPPWAWAVSQDGDSLVYNFDDELDQGIEPGIRIDEDACNRFGLAACDTAFILKGNPISDGLLGDFDNNNLLQATDVDLLSAEIQNASTNLAFDVNGDGAIDSNDHTFWVEDVFGTLLGDADLNEIVAFPDFLALSNHYGQSAGWAGGDFSYDGLVLFDDFLFIARNFGLTSQAASVETVPEPSNFLNAFVFLVLASLRNLVKMKKEGLVS